MIADVDAALRSLLSTRAGEHGAEVAFDAPTRDWSARRSAPTLDVYLYDIREDLDARAVAYEPVREAERTVERRQPPRFFRLSYIVTAWTSRPEDEHRMLSDALASLVLHDALPADSLSGWLAEQPFAIRLEVAPPPSEDRTISDLWTALGGDLKPSVDLVVVTPVDVSRVLPVTAPAVERVVPAAGVAGHEHR